MSAETKDIQRKSTEARGSQEKARLGGGSRSVPCAGLGHEAGDNKVREETMVDIEHADGAHSEARSEYKKAEEAPTNLPALSQQLFICKQCGNRNNNNTFLDPRTGDTV